MSPALADILLTDAQLDLIALRALECSDDAVFAGLAALARAVDEHELPTPAPRCQTSVAPERKPVSRAHKGGLAVAATVAVVLSSSGVAAAVSGDPLAPLHYVARHVMGLAGHQGAQTPGWDLDGAGPVSTIRSVGIVSARFSEYGDAQASRTTLSSALPRPNGWPPIDSTAGHHRSHPSGPGSGEQGNRPKVPVRAHLPHSPHSPREPVAPGGPGGIGTGGSGSLVPLQPSGPRHGHGHGGLGTGAAGLPGNPGTTHGPMPTAPPTETSSRRAPSLTAARSSLPAEPNASVASGPAALKATLSPTDQPPAPDGVPPAPDGVPLAP